jgi:hypothetical protein
MVQAEARPIKVQRAAIIRWIMAKIGGGGTLAQSSLRERASAPLFLPAP